MKLCVNIYPNTNIMRTFSGTGRKIEANHTFIEWPFCYLPRKGDLFEPTIFKGVLDDDVIHEYSENGFLVLVDTYYFINENDVVYINLCFEIN